MVISAAAFGSIATAQSVESGGGEESGHVHGPEGDPTAVPHAHEDDGDVLYLEEEELSIDTLGDAEIAEDDAVDLSVEAVADVTVPEVTPASASELRIDPGLLRAVPRTSAEQLLTLVPSAFLVNHSGTYHAVSYTHLDVYKRQGRARSSCCRR